MNEIKFIFSEDEINIYKNFMQTYYYKFLNKERYPYISTIVKELLPHVFHYNDIYSLSISCFISQLFL